MMIPNFVLSPVRSRLPLGIWLLLFCLGVSGPLAAQSYTFLLLDFWGGITGFSVTGQSVSEPAIVRPLSENSAFPVFLDLEATSTGAYLLSHRGSIIPIGEARLPFAFWTPVPNPGGFALTADGSGGWLGAGHYLKSFGRPPSLVLPPFQPGRQITDVEYDSQRQILTVLIENGGVTRCHASHYTTYPALPLENDRAIDVEPLENGFLVLTANAKVFFVAENTVSLIEDTPALNPNYARDLERSPFGQGFYLLDAFGGIHACDGAPSLSFPIQDFQAVVDLEIIPGTHIPRWFPAGMETQIKILPETLLLDPQGAPKMVSLWIEKAENLADFSVEFHYDPSLLSILPASVKPGVWWGASIQDPHISVALDSSHGILTLNGGGSFVPFEGASGQGELACFSVTAANENLQSASTVLEINGFVFQDASPWSMFRAASTIQSSTIFLGHIQPELTLRWGDGYPVTPSPRPVRPGQVIQMDINCKNGSRIRQVEFDGRFSPNLTLLGMTTGTAWDPPSAVTPVFSTPNEINKTNIFLLQCLQAGPTAVCRDREGSLVTFFFTVTSSGSGSIELNSIRLFDEKNQKILEKNEPEMLMFFSN